MVTRKTSPSNKAPRTRKSAEGFGAAYLAKSVSQDDANSFTRLLEENFKTKAEVKAALADALAEKFELPDGITYDGSLKKDLLLEAYEKLGDENRKLVEAFAEGLLRSELGQEYSSDVRRRGGPDTAPLLYAERENKSEKIVPFIVRVYGGGDPQGGWLDGNMTRADLKHLDPKAYSALNNFESHSGCSTTLEEMNLPTVKQYNDALLERESDDVSSEDAQRLSAARYRRTGTTIPEM